MHRSSSTSRVSDEFFNNSSPSPSPSVRPTSDADKSPTYNPDSHVAKKERSRLRSAENAIHLIPLILVLCAVILWFFSKPAVDIVNKGDSNVARIEDLTINGNVDSDGTQSSLQQNLKLENFNPTKQLVHHNPTILLENKSMFNEFLTWNSSKDANFLLGFLGQKDQSRAFRFGDLTMLKKPR